MDPESASIQHSLKTLGMCFSTAYSVWVRQTGEVREEGRMKDKVSKEGEVDWTWQKRKGIKRKCKIEERLKEEQLVRRQQMKKVRRGQRNGGRRRKLIGVLDKIR